MQDMQHIQPECQNSSANFGFLHKIFTDEDVEEGQIPSSPKGVGKDSSSSSTPSKALSPSPALDSSHNSRYDSSKSRSHSPSNERMMKSRTRSRSRSRKKYVSRSRSRSLSRPRRRRSRSRSPYLGPIIKDYRRGRRGFVRYPRGFRDRGMRSFRRGHHSQQQHYNPYGFTRRHEVSRSRSRSRSFSPKRRPLDVEKNAINSDDEKQSDSKRSDTLKPSDINMSQKRITQSFLAMLEEKQNKSKMVPIESNRSCETSEADDNFNKQHGFVNTFNTVREMDARKHTLSYDLEREGWQVIDDANSESGAKRHAKSREEDRYSDQLKDVDSLYNATQREALNIPEKSVVKNEMSESSSCDELSKKKKKKSKKRKKKRKRKASTSSDSSDSESDNENGEEFVINKKKSKKRKKSSKKKKKALTSSSSSENDEKEEKHKKKKKKKKKKYSSSDSESEDKVEDTLSSTSIQKLVTEESGKMGTTLLIANDLVKEEIIKVKDKKKKHKKTESSDSSDSESDKNERKKKKKNKKKKSKKRKHRSSSSSESSESSDSSESEERKKKRGKKSKKNKKSKKHKKDKKSDKKEKNKLSNKEKKKSKHEEDSKLSEFVTVYSVGDPPLEIKWPKRLIRYTSCEPSLQYSVNPKVPLIEEDFRQIKDERKQIIDELQRKRKFVSEFGSDNECEINNLKTDSNEKLASEYKRFIDELNPSSELSQGISEESLVLEIKMREKLLKQFQNKTDLQEKDLLTPSGKREMERIKKEYHQSFDENESHKSEDLKCLPFSAYHSTKKQHKSSPVHRNEDSEKSAKNSNKYSDSEALHRTNEISISISDRTNKQESQTSEYSSKIDDKKKTARELLERIKQRKHSSKDSDTNSRDDSHNKRMPQFGKIKKPPKKCFTSSAKTSSITTANADSTQNTFVSQPMKLDMNYDYNWYYKYYLDSYAFGQYTAANSASLAAAYYAQYAMITSSDYKQTDLTNWMQQKGYTIQDNEYVMSDNLPNEKSSEGLINSNETHLKPLESNIESHESESISSNIPTADSEALKPEIQNNESAKNDEKTVNDVLIQSQDNVVKKKSINEDIQDPKHIIEVIVSTVNSGKTWDQLHDKEIKNESETSPNMSPFSSAKFKHKVKVRVTTSSQNDSETEGLSSPPPPPPPPMRPQMTTLISTEPITLSNGEVLPSGTKQIVVHPYQSNDAFKFTAEWYMNAYNSHNSHVSSTTTTTTATNTAPETLDIV